MPSLANVTESCNQYSKRNLFRTQSIGVHLISNLCSLHYLIRNLSQHIHQSLVLRDLELLVRSVIAIPGHERRVVGCVALPQIEIHAVLQVSDSISKVS